jgi:hypothetical protein
VGSPGRPSRRRDLGYHRHCLARAGWAGHLQKTIYGDTSILYEYIYSRTRSLACIEDVNVCFTLATYWGALYFSAKWDKKEKRDKHLKPYTEILWPRNATKTI